MYTSIRQYVIPVDSVDTLMQHLEKRFSRIVSGVPGFVAYYAVDAGNGKVVTVSVFEDPAGVEASEKLAAQWASQNFASRQANAPLAVHGEVRVHVTAEDA